MSGKRVCFVSTFVPRKCGLASFTDDLATAMAKLGPQPWVAAVTRRDQPLTYDNRVKLEIIQDDEESYVAAAEDLNAAPVDAVIVQHEYGIFGGPYGRHILTFLKALDKPALVTLHTVVPQPVVEQAEIVRGLATGSEGLVSLAEKGRDILIGQYGMKEDKIYVIRHGVPPAPTETGAALKTKYNLSGRLVLSTFGLLHPGKGIEYALKALPPLVAKHPSALYLILGQTHPEIQERYGDAYLGSLKELTAALGVADNVAFVDRYLTQDEIMEYLTLTDIYVTPYLNPEQISSGPLAYAVALGKAVVSTPYLCAEELLADGRGLLVPFESETALAEALLKLADDPSLADKIRSRAAVFGRSMSWQAVAKEYVELVEWVTAVPAPGPAPIPAYGHGS